MKVLLMTPLPICIRCPKGYRDFIRYLMDIPNITLPQLAACIINYECRILDGITTKVKINEFKEIVKSFDVLGITTHCSSSALNTELNVKFIRKVAPKTKLIAQKSVKKGFENVKFS